jgi:alkylation response protein AidB-like acyl-CoA dehydrogenase
MANQLEEIVREFDASLRPAELALIDVARRFAGEVVRPRAEAWQRRELDPKPTLEEACAAGLATIELPVELGGQGQTFAAKLRIVEELAKADFGFAFALVNHHNALVRIAQAEEAVRSRWLPGMVRGKLCGASAYTEPGHGSDLVNLTSQAERVEVGWRINGCKSWVTGAAWADVFLTLVQMQPGTAADGIALIVVEADRAGFYRDAPYQVAGGQSIGLGGFQLRNYLAPNETLLQQPGMALSAALNGINGARCYVAAMCAGMLEAALETALSYSVNRRAFGQPILHFQGLRWSLVDAATDLTALRLMTYRAARLISVDDPNQRKSAQAAAATAKKFAGDRTVYHLSNCIQALGANGLRDDYPLMRHLLAAKMAAFADGTTEMMNERLGRLLADGTGQT